jgi:hypothetical protein
MANNHRKKRNKVMLKADNEFSALTGLEAIQLSGSHDCLVTNKKTFNGLPVAKVAYIKYHKLESQHRKRKKLLRVYRTCGVDQCVKREHLKAHDPLKDVPPGLIF